MAKIKFSIPQVRPHKLTHPRVVANEIYFAYVVHAGKTSEPGVLPVAGRLSAIRQTGVKKPLKTWVPTTNGSAEPDGMAIEVDVGDAEFASIHLHMYEADNHGLWNDMAKMDPLVEPLTPNAFDWKNAIKPLRDISTVCMKYTDKQDKAICIIKQLVKSASFAVRHLRQDDFLAERTFIVPLGSEPYSMSDIGINSWHVTKYGGDFDVVTDISIV